MSTPQTDLLTPAEYLEIERKSEIKHEYINGRMYAMPGASDPHNVIAINLIVALGVQIRVRPCRLYHADMRVKVSPTGMYTYPDIAALCDRPRFEDTYIDTLLNPAVIIEVLSDSTESYDRGEKFDHYRQIESLREYVLIAQKNMRVEHYERDGELWVFSAMIDAEARLRLPSIACEVTLAEIYAKVEFPPVEKTRAPRTPRPASQ